jgi:hypothetical protein
MIVDDSKNEDNTIKIKIRTLDSNEYSVDIKERSKIEDLKRTLVDVYNII